MDCTMPGESERHAGREVSAKYLTDSIFSKE